MEFLKASELQLNAAGYLISSKTEKPVTYESFISQQLKANYVVKLAEAVKGKIFKSSEVSSLNTIKSEVIKSIHSDNIVKYVDSPDKPVSTTNDEMVKYALDFVEYENSKSNINKINEFMQQFNCINDVETIGEYFQEGLIKLSKIYTIEEIKSAIISYSEITKDLV